MSKKGDKEKSWGRVESSSRVLTDWEQGNYSTDLKLNPSLLRQPGLWNFLTVCIWLSLYSASF